MLQLQQGYPDFPLHFFQLLQGNPKVFPSQPRNIVFSVWPGSSLLVGRTLLVIQGGANHIFTLFLSMVLLCTGVPFILAPVQVESRHVYIITHLQRNWLNWILVFSKYSFFHCSFCLLVRIVWEKLVCVRRNFTGSAPWLCFSAQPNTTV